MATVEIQESTREVVRGRVVDLTDPRDDEPIVLAPRRDGGPSGAGATLKRGLDIVVALLLLAVVAPTMVLAAIAVLVSSGRPILFRQTRVGRGGRLFTMVKFRTYPVGHPDVQVALPIGSCPTPVGRFLRRTSIDELPQLLNVLLGHMSLVGPRPERPRFAAELAGQVPGYLDRLRAPAGLTGLAQVRGLHGTSSLDARVAADNEYIDRWSVWGDLWILLLTVPAILRKAR